MTSGFLSSGELERAAISQRLACSLNLEMLAAGGIHSVHLVCGDEYGYYIEHKGEKLYLLPPGTLPERT